MSHSTLTRTAESGFLSGPGRVVVGVDGSKSSMQALEEAAEIAAWRGWTLDLVTAWDPAQATSFFGYDYGGIAVAAAEAAEESLRDACSYLKDNHPEIPVHSEVVEGAPASVLCERSRGAGILVLGSRGLGGFSSLALGSVGQACVHHAHCPVLIVRPKTRDLDS